MNILQIVHRFLPTFSGGSEIYTYHLCKELSRKHSVSVLFTRRDLTKQNYSITSATYEGLSVTEIINNNFYKNIEETYNNDVVDKIFMDVLTKVQPDVIHIQHLEFLSVNMIRIAREQGIPVVFTLHDFWLMCPREIRIKPDMSLCFEVDEHACGHCISDPSKSLIDLDRPGFNVIRIIGRCIPSTIIDLLKNIRAFLPDSLIKNYQRTGKSAINDVHGAVAAIQERNTYIRDMCRPVNVFVAPSHFLRNEFIKFGIPAEKIIHSLHGHNAVTDLNGKEKASKLRFGFIGTIAKHKGVDILIRAFNRIKKQDVELNIYGDSDFNRGYVRLAKKLNTNPATHFNGKFNHESLPDVFSNIDVLILPAICFENSPMTISEAFMASTPVITSNLGGMAELVRHEENGLLFNVGDPDDLYAKMKMLIDDRKLVDQLVSGIPSVKTIEQDARDFEDRYQYLLRNERNHAQIIS